MLKTETLFSVTIDSLVYQVETDFLTDKRLWINVFFEDGSLLGHHLVPLIKDNEFDFDRYDWWECRGFWWPHLSYKPEVFTLKVQKTIDTYLNMKAFW